MKVDLEGMEAQERYRDNSTIIPTKSGAEGGALPPFPNLNHESLLFESRGSISLSSLAGRLPGRPILMQFNTDVLQILVAKIF